MNNSLSEQLVALRKRIKGMRSLEYTYLRNEHLSLIESTYPLCAGDLLNIAPDRRGAIREHGDKYIAVVANYMSQHPDIISARRVKRYECIEPIARHVEICRLVTKSQNYLSGPFDDPEVCAMLARKATEAICSQIYRNALGKEVGDRSLDKIISELKQSKVFPRRASTQADTVQRIGNWAVHYHDGEYGSPNHQEVAGAVSSLIALTQWYMNEMSTIGVADIDVVDLEIPCAAAFKISDAGIKTLKQLLPNSSGELTSLCRLSKSEIDKVTECLSDHGLALGTPTDIPR